MHRPAKSRRYRSTAVIVLLGWLFSIAVTTAYGCTLWDASHQHHAPSADASAHVMQSYDASDAASAGDADVCKAACDLQASPALKDASGNAPDLHPVVLHTSAYIVALAPPTVYEPDKPFGSTLPYTESPSLRSTRLTL